MFYFDRSRYCTGLLSFVDLNPIGACVAEEQQSDKKLSKSESKQSLSWGGTQDKWRAVSPPTGEISILTLVFPTSYINT